MAEGNPAPTPAPAPARKLKPQALIYKDYCTGCEACIQMCPINDCIIRTGDSPNVNWCYVVPQKCIGCTLCVKICPWDCIEMIPREQYPQGVYTGAPGSVIKPTTAA